MSAYSLFSLCHTNILRKFPRLGIDRFLNRSKSTNLGFCCALQLVDVHFLGAVAELIPHLALFISLIGAFSGSSMALLFPPFIDLLVIF